MVIDVANRITTTMDSSSSVVLHVGKSNLNCTTKFNITNCIRVRNMRTCTVAAEFDDKTSSVKLEHPKSAC